MAHNWIETLLFIWSQRTLTSFASDTQNQQNVNLLVFISTRNNNQMPTSICAVFDVRKSDSQTNFMIEIGD